MAEEEHSNSQEENSAEYHATDVADRLYQIMLKIEAAAKELSFTNSYNSQTNSGLDTPLYQVFEPLAVHLGFDDYAALQDNFVALCARVTRDIKSIPVKNQRTQDRWVSAVKTARDVFNASNFQKNCSKVFDKHFSYDVYVSIEDASERIQAVGKVETSEDDLLEALNAARDALRAYEQSGDMPETLGKILKLHLQEIERAYGHYRDFGDEVFWATYKQLFGTFLQVHDVVFSDDAGSEAQAAVRTMAEKLKFGLTTMAVSSDVATLTTTFAGLLPK